MVTPDRRRRAVMVLQERFGVHSGGHARWWVSTVRPNVGRLAPNRLRMRSCGAVIPVWDGAKPTTWYVGRALW